MRTVPDIAEPLSGLQGLLDFPGIILTVRFAIPLVSIALGLDSGNLPITNLVVLRRNPLISVNLSLSLFSVKILDCLDFCLFLETLFSVDDVSIVHRKLYGIFAQVHDGLW